MLSSLSSASEHLQNPILESDSQEQSQWRELQEEVDAVKASLDAVAMVVDRAEHIIVTAKAQDSVTSEGLWGFSPNYCMLIVENASLVQKKIDEADKKLGKIEERGIKTNPLPALDSLGRLREARNHWVNGWRKIKTFIPIVNEGESVNDKVAAAQYEDAVKNIKKSLRVLRQEIANRKKDLTWELERACSPVRSLVSNRPGSPFSRSGSPSSTQGSLPGSPLRISSQQVSRLNRQQLVQSYEGPRRRCESPVPRLCTTPSPKSSANSLPLGPEPVYRTRSTEEILDKLSPVQGKNLVQGSSLSPRKGSSGQKPQPVPLRKRVTLEETRNTRQSSSFGEFEKEVRSQAPSNNGSYASSLELGSGVGGKPEQGSQLAGRVERGHQRTGSGWRVVNLINSWR